MRHASVLLIAALFAVGAPAQTFVYPAKGQSADQQKKDEARVTPGRCAEAPFIGPR